MIKPKRPGFIKAFTGRHLKTRPVVNISACTGCAACKKNCPTKAVELFPCIPMNVELPRKTGEPRQRPEVNYNKCIRCYRCLELCPHEAIGTFKPRIMKILRLT